VSSFLGQLLSAPLVTDVDTNAKASDVPDVEAWWRVHRALAERHASSGDLALWAGFAANRPAWAFLSGYQAALGALLPSLAPDRRAALAVTEDAGNHPRAITTELTGDAAPFVLAGEKSFVTLGPSAHVLLVLATRGIGDDGRPRLVLVQVPRDAIGVRVETLPPLPFIAEVPHGRAVFDGVAVASDAVLPGDGYADYSKPFRTIEDAHVHGALVAYFARLARRHRAPAVVLAELAALAQELHGLCAADPMDPETHVLLGVAIGRVARVAEDERLWNVVDDATRSLWIRDRPILGVAAGARSKRLDLALLAIGARAWVIDP